MSVPKSKRQTSTLEVLTKSRELALYTIKICNNENNFPKRYRWCLTNEIIKCSTNISEYIAMANSIYVVIKIRPSKIKNEKRKLKRLIKRVENGYMTKKDVDESYRAFRNTLLFGNNYNTKIEMDIYYKNLWREYYERTPFDQNGSTSKKPSKNKRIDE